MDDKTLQALTALANKLGTTAEYLWGVLLKQAPISGIADLVICILLIIAAVVLVKFANSKTKPRKPSGSNYEYSEWGGEGAFFAWVVCIFFWAFTLIHVVVGINEIAAALFNPEYWALMQILK